MAEFKMPSMPAPAAAAGAKTDPNAHPLIYEAPFWSAVPTENHGYSLEVISQGSVLGTISLQTKPFYLIGRVPICDVVVENDVCNFGYNELASSTLSRADEINFCAKIKLTLFLRLLPLRAYHDNTQSFNSAKLERLIFTIWEARTAQS